MSYIGATPLIGNYQKCDAITTSATDTFNILVGGVAVSPATPQNCIVSLNGVIQAPTTAYTVSGSTIVFDSALTTSDVIDFIVILGNVLDIGTPSDDTVTAAKLNDTAISGQTALGAAPADTDEFLVSDAGTLKRVDYSYIKATSDVSWQAIETGSTMTAVAGRGYWIDTTSNSCVITLPSSASNGDQIVFADYARTWGTNGIELDSNGLNYQGQDDSYAVEYGTDGTALHIVYSGATKGWIPTLDKTVEDVPSLGNDEGIFLWGDSGGTNLISNTGVVSADTSTPAGAVAKQLAAATQYGGDKGIVALSEILM